MGAVVPYYRTFLKEELERRTKLNKQYSLRAFAGSLKLDPTYLSKVLSGKLIMSMEVANSLCEILEVNADERENFLLSLAEEKRCAAIDKVAPDLTDCD